MEISMEISMLFDVESDGRNLYDKMLDRSKKHNIEVDSRKLHDTQLSWLD